VQTARYLFGSETKFMMDGFMMDGGSVRAEPFPASSKKTVGTVNGVSTEIETLSFADKIMITVSQGGRLAQWVSCR
jgi:proteasome assembly chaperone 3